MKQNPQARPGRLPAVDVTLLAAATTLFIAGLILVGLIFDIRWLRPWLSDQVSMKANTAVAFLIAGILLIVSQWQPRHLTIALRVLLSGSLLLLALVTLTQYLFDVRINIDELLFDAPAAAPMTSSPGRMAPTTAICFCLFAAAILLDLLRTWHGRIASRGLATVVLLIALTSILGYAFGAPVLYLGVDGVTAMSLSTAILFIAVSLGVVWLQPQYGFPAMLTEKSVVGTYARSLLPMVVAAPLLAGSAVVAGYGRFYEGHFAIALTSLGSMLAAGIVAAISLVVLRRSDDALYIRDRALAATTSGVLITDHSKVNEPIIYANPAFTAMTGYSPDEIIGRNCRFLNQGVANESGVLDDIRETIEQGKDGSFELKNCRSDGSEFWNRLSLAPIANHDGEVTHFVGIVDDATERYEQELRLQEALESAQTANAMRDAFVRLVSHELRTPLNAALTWIRLMEVDDDDETRQKGLGIVAQSIQSQSRLIDDLSDVSRVASHGVRIEPEPSDARALIEETIEELRPSMEPKLTVTVDISPGNYAAVVDPLRLKQIVRNLLGNATKYSAAGGSVHIRLLAEQDAFVLDVADTGKGLTAEQATQVFEPFWQADAELPGMGVGLTIVAALVAAHGGEINVASDGAGRGTTFSVRLPLDASPGSHQPVTVTHVEAVDETGPST